MIFSTLLSNIFTQYVSIFLIKMLLMLSYCKTKCLRDVEEGVCNFTMNHLEMFVQFKFKFQLKNSFQLQ